MKKKQDLKGLEELGRVLIDIALNAFTRAYQERMAGATLDGLLIELDIKVAYNNVAPAVHAVKTIAIKQADEAVRLEVPLRRAITIMQLNLEKRLQEELDETE